MATEKQIEANRRNAQHSTGPRTEAGKEISARNATRLGLFSRHVLLPGEDEAELTALRDGIRARCKPADALEEIYVERIVTASWRLQRALAHEAHCYVAWHNIHRQFAATPDHLPRNESCPVEDLADVQKHIASLERSIDKAVVELGKLQKARREAKEEANLENEPNSRAGEEVTGSMQIEIVKTNPIGVAEEPGEVGNREIEPNSAPGSLNDPAGAEPSMLQPPGGSDRP